jgi:predicted DNA-binding transcriptional regulator AlpA
MTATFATESQHKISRVFLRLCDLPEVTGLSLRTLNRLRAQNRLPSPDAQFGRALCWRPATIREWAETGGLADQNASR